MLEHICHSSTEIILSGLHFSPAVASHYDFMLLYLHSKF